MRHEVDGHADHVDQQAASALGAVLTVSQIVEEVLLNAFENYARRPAIRMGPWLESLIDPSIQQLLRHRDEEQENLSFIESAKVAENERQTPHRLR